MDINPNFVTLDPFGEPTGYTLIGYRPHPVNLTLAQVADPTAQGRRLFWAMPNDPTHTNRIGLVLSPKEAGPHRFLLYRGEELTMMVPVEAFERRRQEVKVAEESDLTGEERKALNDLRKAVGSDWRTELEEGHVAGISFFGNVRLDRAAGILPHLPSLHTVRFGGCALVDEPLVDLARLSKLTTVTFSSMSIPRGGLVKLRELRGLQRLIFLSCSGIRDEDLKPLGELHGLKRLSFNSENYGDHLPAAGTSITDAGVAHLQSLKQLVSLDLVGQEISDRSLPILLGLTELQDLGLSGHGLTDNGILTLTGLPKLQALRLFETDVTTNAVAELKRRVSGLNVNIWSRKDVR